MNRMQQYYCKYDLYHVRLISCDMSLRAQRSEAKKSQDVALAKPIHSCSLSKGHRTYTLLRFHPKSIAHPRVHNHNRSTGLDIIYSSHDARPKRIKI